jgi:uncharacterized protein|tara:strand:+ start:2509 stop:2898 length:390 start_codon:yes stop_codon:yes gene_type:complete
MIEGKRYIDIDFDFTAHPVSGDLVLKYNEEAVKKSVRSLVLTNKYDRPFQPSISGRVRELLFENITPMTGVILKSHIENVLNEHEPRIKLLGVDVVENHDYNLIEVTISFSIKNQPEVLSLTTVLERTR